MTGVAEVAVPAVAMLGELFQQIVVVVLDADSDGYEAQGVGVVVVASGFEDGERIGSIDVGYAIGHEDDVVVGVGVGATCLVGKLHAQIEAGLDVGGVAPDETTDGARDVRVVGSCGGQ